MAYEITYHFFEKSDVDEDFDKDESNLKERTVKVGQPGEPVLIEKVAATILREYTKQNVWIDRVEISEWVKKPLRCTQTKGGVKIGQKTFNLGLNEIMKWAVDDVPPPIEMPAIQPQQPPQPQQPQQPQVTPQPVQPQQQIVVPNQQQPGEKVWPHEVQAAVQQGQMQRQMAESAQTYANNTSAAYPGQEPRMRLQNKVSGAGLQYAQRVEVCDPPSALKGDLTSLNLTLGKQYQILDEQTAPNPRAQGGVDLMYRIQNDVGKEAFVSCHYFRQQQGIRQEVSYYDQYGNLQTAVQLVDQGAETASNQPRPRLLYEDAQEPPMYRSVAQNPGGSNIDGMLARMDQAVQRRTRQ